MTQTADIVICGAGSIGIAVAYYLAQWGGGDVVLVDKHPPLSQTSAKSGENYRNWWPQPEMCHLMNRSIDLLEGLARESDNVFSLTRRGYVYATMDKTAVLSQTLPLYQPLPVGEIRLHTSSNTANYAPISPNWKGQPNGADILLDRDLIRRTFPHFADGVTAVIHARRGGDLSAQQLGMYLLKQAKRRGVVELRGEVVGFERDAGGITAVCVQTATERQTIHTRTFVNAAGPFAPHINTLLGVDLPIANVFQQKVAFDDPLRVIPRTAPFTIFEDSQTLPWHDDERELLQAEPDYQWLLGNFPGGLHIKADGGENGSWIKLGWAFNQTAEEAVWKRQRLSEFLDIVLHGASRLVPGLAAYFDNVSKPVAHYGGYYSKTPENLPLIGSLGVAGAYICSAFAGFGTMASCAAGDLLADWVCGTALPAYAAAFAPARYQDPAYVAGLAGLEKAGEL
ncbi:MAG: FAD-binding oxidoreductase [Ardenticatenaceae bacterium]|nr:FAD-binding oxidoreductase [Ardenticatenaceae bacterium]